MSLSVKLFVKKAGSKDEVDTRRFSIDEDVCTSYDYLMAKIHATIGAANGTAIRLFWKDEEGEMISFSSDDELIEALSHVVDGVLRVYVELADNRPANSVHHFQPYQFLAALSNLLPGLSNAGGPCGNAGHGLGEPGFPDCRSETSGQETKDAKDETERNGQEFRQLIVDTANAFLEPLGLQVVDKHVSGHSCDREPAAGARMTSPQCDPDVKDDRQGPGADSHAYSADAATPTATARGRLNEMMSMLGFDGEVGSCLSNFVVDHAEQLAQAMKAASAVPAAATG